MKNNILKKILLAIILVFTSISIVSAETIAFNGTAFCHKEVNRYGNWTSWSNWQRCNVPITIDLNRDIVTILSENTQYYKIVSYGSEYRERGATVLEYKFYDADGDRGTMLLVQKDNGNSEIYIYFANVAWAYTVVRY